jgi:two-component system alkaline phosphatase synthesis response regulator PhoP
MGLFRLAQQIVKSAFLLGGRMSKLKILIIEDELNIVELLKYNLETNGYEVDFATDGLSGLQKIKTIHPNLVLLDLMLPLLDGVELCKKVKYASETEHIPIIMLTAKGTEMDKVIGLEIGADDYLTKPFSIRELLARIKVVLKRSQNDPKPKTDIFQVLDLTVDVVKHEVKMKEELLQLTFKEFELLKILIENRGRVLTRDQLLDEVWGYEYYGETRTVDVHIRHLRKKIGDLNSDYIETIRGVGYKIK